MRDWARSLFKSMRRLQAPIRNARPLRPRTFRPCLELLEDRLAPFVFNVMNGDVTTLIANITTANSNGEADTINLAAGGLYILSAVDNSTVGNSGLPVILADSSNALIINGNGATLQRDRAGGTPAFRFASIGNGA